MSLNLILVDAVSSCSWSIITKQPSKLIDQLMNQAISLSVKASDFNLTCHSHVSVTWIYWILLLHVADDLMEGTELAVRDVADLLHPQYAIVTGKQHPQRQD
jgi:hypothetical protein